MSPQCCVTVPYCTNQTEAGHARLTKHMIFLYHSRLKWRLNYRLSLHSDVHVGDRFESSRMTERKLCITMKTYGPKSQSFKLPDGKEYCLAKRSLDREIVMKQGYNPALVSSNVWIFKANKVEDILSGNDDKYRAFVHVSSMLDQNYMRYVNGCLYVSNLTINTL